MPRSVTLADGTTTWVPDGLTPDAEAQYLAGRGVSVGQLPGVIPQARDLAPAGPIPSTGAVDDFFTAAGLYIANRTPGLREQFQGLQGPDSLSATLGGASVPTALGFLVPGAGLPGVLSQGALSGGLEALRGGSAADVATEAGMGGLFAGVGDLFGRAVSGAARTVKALRGSGVLATTDDWLRTAGETVGGRAVVDRVNQAALNRAAAASFGQQATKITPDVLDAAADTLGRQFDALVPDTAIIPRAGFDQAVGALDAGALGPRVTRNLPPPGQPLDGKTFRALRSSLAERARKFLGDSPNLADDLADAVEQLDLAAEQTLGPQYRQQFRQVREMWKNLRIVESLQSVRAGNNVSAAQLTTRLAQEGPGYGTSFLRNTGNVLPGTQDMFDVARTLVNDAAGRVGNSGTATRAAATGLLGGAAGLATGATAPATVAAGVGAAALGQAAGLASVGKESANVARLAAGASRGSE